MFWSVIRVWFSMADFIEGQLLPHSFPGSARLLPGTLLNRAKPAIPRYAFALHLQYDRHELFIKTKPTGLSPESYARQEPGSPRF